MDRGATLEIKRIMPLLLVAGVVLAGCRSMYYSTWEKLGREKRDLLERKVEQVRNGQVDTTKQLQDALTRMQEMYGFTGGELGKAYKRLKADYERSVDKSNGVRKRIKKMDQVARDMFKEWESEAKTIQTPSLREYSLAELRETRQRYESVYQASSRAEKSIRPVLSKLHDYVLSLKHSLNAQAVGALQTEAGRIQADVNQLIVEMNASIREADAFIKANK